MTRWNDDQKQLAAEALSNLAVGTVLIGIITPVFTGVKDAILFILTIIFILGFSALTYFLGFKILRK